MNIEVSSKEIGSRRASIRQLLKPIADKPNDLFVIPKPTVDEFIVAVHGKGFGNSGDFNNLRFKTIADNFYAMYYERWKRTFIGKNEFFYLYRAYLHIY